MRAAQEQDRKIRYRGFLDPPFVSMYLCANRDFDLVAGIRGYISTAAGYTSHPRTCIANAPVEAQTKDPLACVAHVSNRPSHSVWFVLWLW